MKKTVVLLSIVSILPLSSMASSFSCNDFEATHTRLLSCNVAERNERFCVLKDSSDNRIAVAVINEESASVTWTFKSVKRTSDKLVAHDRDLFGLNRYDVKLELNVDDSGDFANGSYEEDLVRNDYVGDRSHSTYSATLKNCQ